ncbi:MAG: RNB domain-containing ribonuclease [bacterium]|nr:RNB domain-containing ribonuclease [bacterium]
MLLKENEIAFFRYRNRLLAGVCLAREKGKARFAVSAKEAVNVPLENVLLTTGQVSADAGVAEAWMARAEADGAPFDLIEVWDLVREEGTVWQLAELAEFYFQDGVAPEHLGALLMHLEACDYFERNEAGYRARDEAEVEQKREEKVREAAREEEKTLFQRWFLQEEEMDNLEGHRERWIEALKDYVLYGESSTYARSLERLAGQRVDDRRAFQHLVKVGAWESDVHLELVRKEVRVHFPEPVLLAAETLQLEDLLADPRRRDLTDVPVFTVDDENTTDMDDGMSIVFREDGSSQLGVHITDMASLIPMNSDLDREAAARVSSLYFPEQKIPMFPDRISRELGSLCPGVPRLALSMLFEVTAEGEVGAFELVPSVICCRDKLSYNRVDAVLEDRKDPYHAPFLFLHRIAEAHWVERLHQGAISVEHPDRQIQVDSEGKVEISMQPRNSRANLLVSELMVMANSGLAGFCRDQEIPIAFRTQQAPDLSELEEDDNEILHRYRILRRMRRASMSVEPGLHGGLGVEPYCQVSSPLRRYADLVVQRQVIAFLTGQDLPYHTEDIRNTLFATEERMGELIRLERRRERYWLLKYLSRFIGEEFEAMVLEAWDREVNVEILALAFQTAVRFSRPVTPGERVRLRLGRSDPWADDLSFTPLD